MLQVIAACVASTGLMGQDNALPWPSLAPDMQHFRAFTRGKTVIMGRRTYESIGRALPMRENIVLSRDGFVANDAQVCSSLTEALRAATHQPVVIGGASLYREALERGASLSLTLLFPPEAWQAPRDTGVYFPLENVNFTQMECTERFESHGWRGEIWSTVNTQ